MSHTTAQPLVLDLASPMATLEQVGGKGASLARMAAAGLTVPPGFHITTAAYWRFVADNDLQAAILAAATDASAEDPASLESASARIVAGFVAADIPATIADAIRGAYARLVGGDAAVAV